MADLDRLAHAGHGPCVAEINRIQVERDRALREKAEAEALAFGLREALALLTGRARMLHGCELTAGSLVIDLSKEIDLAKRALAAEELVP